jgi:hypothetical protein
MIHVTCDLCGKEIRTGEDQHYVVRIEVYAAGDPTELTDDDLDEDHMESLKQELEELEASGEEPDVAPRRERFRYDLCASCRQRFAKDPLAHHEIHVAKKEASTFDFSEN